MSFHKDQIPFVTMRAVNDTLFDVQKHTKTKTFPSAFKNQAKARGMVNKRTFRVDKSKNKHKVEASFGTIGKTDYLQMQHVDGKTRKPHSGKWMLTPQFGRGRVSKSKRHTDHSPAALLKRHDFFFGRAGNTGRGRQTLTGSTGGGAIGIWQRKRKGRGKNKTNGLVLWYAATKTQDFSGRKDTLKFYEDANRVFISQFPLNFSKNMVKALRSSKK